MFSTKMCGVRRMGWESVRHPVAWLATLFSVVLATCVCAFALDPSLAVTQYAHTGWKVRDGFTKGKINAIAQTPDGYLWLGTDFGLLRFDGVRTLPWRPPAGQQLPNENVSSLFAARDGTLWIGTLRGPASWRDGRLKQYPELTDFYIVRILEDLEGTIWMSGSDPLNGKVCRFRSGRADCQGETTRLGSGAFGLYEDRQGNIWVGAVSGLWQWKPGPPKLYPLPGEMFGVEALAEETDGALLVGWRGALRRFVGGKLETVPLRGVGPVTATCMLRDRDGGLWIGTRTKGLLHVHQGKTEVFTLLDGLSGATVQNIVEDREGSVWVVTASGLDRFRDFAVTTFTARQGLSADLVSSVLADRDGSVWLATYGGLDSWRDGEISAWGKRGGKLDGLNPTSLFQDSHGKVWVSTNRDFGYLERDRFVPINGFPGGIVDGIAEDSRGDLWVANQNEGLIHLSGTGVIEKIPWSRLGRKDNAKALAADPIRGGLWLGFYDGGVEHFADGKVQASYTATDGLGKGRVNSFRVEQSGTLWAATEGGLSRLKDGRFFTIGTKNGLPCDGVHWTVEDNDHSLWLYMQCGLVRIARPDVEGWIIALDKDNKRSIAFEVFDGFDGTPSLAAALWRYAPTVTKSLDGRIWFKGFEGVSIIDPHHLPFNRVPPPVHVEQIIADRKVYDASAVGNAHLQLPRHVRDLAIDYTAPSFIAPEKVHFRYKLEGQDPDWREVVNDREVQYSNLPPKHYRFRLLACNNSGVWNTEGATLDFWIPPAWYQTNWFRAFCVVGFLALLWAAYRLRVRQLRRQEKKLRDVVETMPTFVWTTLPDGSRDFANQQVQEYSGLPVEETNGSRWQGVVHPDDVKQHLEKWHASLATGEPFQSEARYRRADGEYRWFLARGVPMRDEHGKIVKWYGVSTDIEDRKRAEAEIKALKDQLYRENLALRDEIDRASMFEEIIGTSKPLKAVLSQIAKVAPTDSTVLITGETGTGKERVARAVHKRSRRSERAFVSVNCAALAPSLISSELFGHEKGAFTGATQRRLGRFELADGGTIFLDEVGELSPDTQVALLRVLQEREFERVGGTQSIKVNVRVIAATNRDLKGAVAKGSFREDLFYRLNVFPIELPPLRERRDDIPMLVEYFVQLFSKRAGKNIRSIDLKTLDLLQAYDWPGNIRELQNVIERSVILCSGEMLSFDDLRLAKASSRVGAWESKDEKDELWNEREIIEAALAETEGRVYGLSGAAAKLGIPPSTLDHRIKALKIDKGKFKSR